MKATLVFFCLMASTAFGSTLGLSAGEGTTIGDTSVTCSEAGAPKTYCHLLGAGTYDGNDYSFRLAIGSNIVSASDSLATVIDSVGEYRKTELCENASELACSLQGAGVYAGNDYGFRVMVGDQVVYGSDSQSEALSTIVQLRKSILCK